jgi:hypothetical protein
VTTTLDPARAISPAGPGDRSAAPLLLHVGLVLGYVGTAVLRPQVAGSLSFVDPILGALCAYGVWSMTAVGSTATRSLVRVLPWVWLIYVGSLLGLSHVGMTQWAIQSLLQTTLALLTFFCVWHLIEVYGLYETATRGAVLAFIVGVVSLVVVPYTYRASGWFPNPNYPGHFGALGAALLVCIGSPRVKLLGLVGGAIVLWTTASFGAIAMCVVMLAVAVARAVERYTAVLAVVLGGLVVATALFLAAPAEEVETESGSWQVKGVISEDRFDKSQGSRAEIWSKAISELQDEPLGIGPNGVHSREIATERGRPVEIHSDVIGFLVERGVVGLIGLLGLWFVIWRSAPAFGVTRLLLAACLISGMFREVIHYRHMWMFLALAMAVDHARSRRPTDDDPVHDVPPDRYPHPVPAA